MTSEDAPCRTSSGLPPTALGPLPVQYWSLPASTWEDCGLLAPVGLFCARIPRLLARAGCSLEFPWLCVRGSLSSLHCIYGCAGGCPGFPRFFCSTIPLTLRHHSTPSSDHPALATALHGSHSVIVRSISPILLVFDCVVASQLHATGIVKYTLIHTDTHRHICTHSYTHAHAHTH